jgi:ribosomal protein S7
LGIRRSFEPFLPRKSIVEMNLRAGHRLANYDRPDDPLDFRTHGIESNFVRSFIYNKKDVNKVLVHDRNIARAKFDKIPQKFFFYNHNLDPLYGSFILNKVINAVSSKGKKKYIRNLFYNIISENRPDLSAAVIGFIIQSLKPSFLNVPVRRGKETYNAPIPASDLKATVKAIHFFVRGVYSHRYLDTLEEKIATEILDYLYWWGYSNM